VSKIRFKLYSSGLIESLQATQLKFDATLKEQKEQQTISTSTNKKPISVCFSQQFTQPQLLDSLQSTSQEKRQLEDAIFNYIVSRTNFLSNQILEINEKILKQYIELYVYNPGRYPVDPKNKIHCLVHEAGNYVLEQIDQMNQKQKKKNKSPWGTNSPFLSPTPNS